MVGIPWILCGWDSLDSMWLGFLGFYVVGIPWILCGWDSLELKRCVVQFFSIPSTLGHVWIPVCEEKIFDEMPPHSGHILTEIPTSRENFIDEIITPWGNNFLKILAHNWWHCSADNCCLTTNTFLNCLLCRFLEIQYQIKE